MLKRSKKGISYKKEWKVKLKMDNICVGQHNNINWIKQNKQTKMYNISVSTVLKTWHYICFPIHKYSHIHSTVFIRGCSSFLNARHLILHPIHSLFIQVFT